MFNFLLSHFLSYPRLYFTILCHEERLSQIYKCHRRGWAILHRRFKGYLLDSSKIKRGLGTIIFNEWLISSSVRKIRSWFSSSFCRDWAWLGVGCLCFTYLCGRWIEFLWFLACLFRIIALGNACFRYAWILTYKNIFYYKVYRDRDNMYKIMAKWSKENENINENPYIIKFYINLPHFTSQIPWQ